MQQSLPTLNNSSFLSLLSTFIFVLGGYTILIRKLVLILRLMNTIIYNPISLHISQCSKVTALISACLLKQQD